MASKRRSTLGPIGAIIGSIKHLRYVIGKPGKGHSYAVRKDAEGNLVINKPEEKEDQNGKNNNY